MPKQYPRDIEHATDHIRHPYTTKFWQSRRQQLKDTERDQSYIYKDPDGKGPSRGRDDGRIFVRDLVRQDAVDTAGRGEEIHDDHEKGREHHKHGHSAVLDRSILHA